MTPRRAVALAVAAFAAQAGLAVLSAGTSGSYCYADMASWALSLGCERAP